jgi:hypothetical protein
MKTTPDPRLSLAFLARSLGQRGAVLLLRIWWLPVGLGALALGFLLYGPAIGQGDATQAAPKLYCTAFARPIVAVGEVSLTAEDTLALGVIVRQAHDATLAAAALPANRDEARHQIQAATVEELERFISAYPESAWVPSLRANLGKHYRDIGRYTLALEHWGAAWEALKGAADGPAKVEGDYALARYARLLAEFCRMEALELLLQETQGRVLDRGPLSQMMVRTREAYAMMRVNPGVAYRCGNLALHRLATTLEVPGYRPRNVLMAAPAPFGLSAAMMVELARAGGLDLMAVERVAGGGGAGAVHRAFLAEPLRDRGGGGGGSIPGGRPVVPTDALLRAGGAQRGGQRRVPGAAAGPVSRLS